MLVKSIRYFHSGLLTFLSAGLIILTITAGCQKIDYKRVAKIVTGSFSNLSATSVTLEGDLLDLGEGTDSEYGFCYDKQNNPTLNSGVESKGAALYPGVFTTDLSGLDAATTYYYRAYVVVNGEPVYGEVSSFTTDDGIIELSTSGPNNIRASAFNVRGEITDDGGAPVTARGFCWAEGATPSSEDNPVQVGDGTGEYATEISGMDMNVTYRVRAWATNSVGTYYGDEIEVTIWWNIPGPDVSDIDGNNYNSKKIGGQTWMVQNLQTTKYRDGSNIPHETNVDDWTGLSSPAYCWYENNIGYKEKFGALYNWYTVDQGDLCPAGWHVPTDQDFQVLEDFLISTELTDASDIGGLLKSTDDSWDFENTGATNESGFGGLPAGARGADPEASGDFSMTYVLFLWSTMADINENAIARNLYSYEASFPEGSYPKKLGASVRCVKDD